MLIIKTIIDCCGVLKAVKLEVPVDGSLDDAIVISHLLGKVPADRQQLVLTTNVFNQLSICVVCQKVYSSN